MKSKTRYEETPASELPKELKPVSINNPPKKSDFYMTNIGCRFFSSSTNEWKIPRIEQGKYKLVGCNLAYLTHWYKEIEPSEPQAVSGDVEGAKAILFKKIHYTSWSEKNINDVVSAMLEFSQQQQQGQVAIQWPDDKVLTLMAHEFEQNSKMSQADWWSWKKGFEVAITELKSRVKVVDPVAFVTWVFDECFDYGHEGLNIKDKYFGLSNYELFKIYNQRTGEGRKG